MAHLYHPGLGAASAFCGLLQGPGAWAIDSDRIARSKERGLCDVEKVQGHRSPLSRTERLRRR